MKSSSRDKFSHIEDSDEKTKRDYKLPSQFLKLNLDKIRECIDLLEEHYKDCIAKDNLTEAKSAHQRILLFKEMEKEKMKSEAKKIYKNQQLLIEEKMNEEIEAYSQETENEFKKLAQAFEGQELELLKQHEEELDQYKSEFVKEFNNKKPKPSSECLNWMRIKEACIQSEDLYKAREAAEHVVELRKKDLKKFEEEKNRKLNSELKSILRRQENEKNALGLKKKSCIDMFIQTRDKNLEQIRKKYETKLKELKNYQAFEMANFNKITRGITSTCSRIQSIVNSATGLKDEEEGEQEEQEEQGQEKEEKIPEAQGEEENNKENIHENNDEDNNEIKGKETQEENNEDNEENERGEEMENEKVEDVENVENDDEEAPVDDLKEDLNDNDNNNNNNNNNNNEDINDIDN